MNLEDWIPSTQEAHAIAAHMPVALSALGVVGVLVAIVVKTQRDSLRWAVVGLYLLLAATAWISVETGEDARAEVSGAIAADIWDTIDQHQKLADRVWMFALGTAVVMAGSIAAKGGLRTIMSVVTLVASIATAGWVTATGHQGGKLVYEHGIGIPPDKVVEWRINPPAAEPGAQTSAPTQDNGRPLIPIEPIDMAEAAKISWTNDIYPIFEEVCIECHKPGQLDAELDMTTVAGLLKGGEKYGPAIMPGKPDESTTVKYSRGELLPQMPKDEFPLTKEELHIIRLWIAAGAVDDSGETAPLEN